MFLQPRPDGVYVDATVGLGGHTAALLDAGAGRVIGIDRDRAALDRTRRRLAAKGDRVVLVHAEYRHLDEVLDRAGVGRVQGVVADLGASSAQFDDAARGFSFRQAGPLDMRMDPSQGESLGRRLADVNEGELADVVRRFGEERHARQVARAIVRARDRGALETTADLAAAVRRAAGRGRWSRLDPATRTFQALRIWVNDELAALEALLPAAAGRLEPGSRLAVIAFHSLEDRIVKRTLRRMADEGTVRLVTRRPVVPGPDERARNPRARSARLRVAERAA